MKGKQYGFETMNKTRLEKLKAQIRFYVEQYDFAQFLKTDEQNLYVECVESVKSKKRFRIEGNEGMQQ